MLTPPKDVPADRLFRLLLRRPRPVLPLAFRFDFAPSVALSVRGLTAYEDAEIGDGDTDDPTRRSLLQRRMIAAMLLADGRPAFADADEVGNLTEHEIIALGNAVAEAMAIVSPQFRNVDRDAWDKRLQEGARHPLNIALAASMYIATDSLVGHTKLIHLAAPDRYFGLPIADITDGQLLAYYAAKAIMDKVNG